ncbi:conjugal transfer protein TrbL family protein [Brevibacillus porteri]|uniref:conjugal transfer protein TrbL family protein n=1 Tax=Brevibacillus porteri TaxID=2126350 RepID=UPI003D244D56
MEWINELLYNAMLFSVQKFIENAINEYIGAIVSLREMSLNILDQNYFLNALLYAQGISALLLAIKVGFEAKAIHILRLDGSPDADPAGLLKGTVVSAAIIATVPWIVRQVWSFGLSVQREVGQLPGTDIGSEQDALLNFLLTCITGDEVLFIGVIGAVVVFLLVMFQTLVIAVDFTVIALMGYWMALGLTNQQSNAFSVWWKDLQGAAMIPSLQLLVLKGAFVAWGSMTSLSPGARLLLFILLMYGAYRVPQKVQVYVGYTSSGTGRTTVNMAQTVFSKLLMKR